MESTFDMQLLSAPSFPLPPFSVKRLNPFSTGTSSPLLERWGGSWLGVVFGLSRSSPFCAGLSGFCLGLANSNHQQEEVRSQLPVRSLILRVLLPVCIPHFLPQAPAAEATVKSPGYCHLPGFILYQPHIYKLSLYQILKITQFRCFLPKS